MTDAAFSSQQPSKNRPLALTLTSIELLAIRVDLTDDELRVKEVGRVHLAVVEELRSAGYACFDDDDATVFAQYV